MYEKLHPIEKRIFDVLACALVLFYSCNAVVWYATTTYYRGACVLVTYVLVFLTYKSQIKLGFFDWGIVKFLSGICRMESFRQDLAEKFQNIREDRQPTLETISRAIDILFIVLTIFSVGYWVFTYECVCYRVNTPPPPLKIFAGVIGVLVSIEVARRVVGIGSVIVCIAMLACGVHGFSFPEQWTWLPEWLGMLSFDAVDSFPELCYSIFYRADGVFGFMTSFMATYVIMFVVFGAFWEASGARRFFIGLPKAVLGHKTGGPAKVAIVASGVSGSFTGNAVTNNVSTGPFTVPIMKQAGYRPHVAGGIKAAGSVSGLLMPPAMGVVGFLMAELTGMSYSEIMPAAVFPAFMYFFSVFTMVHFQAKIHGFKGEKSGHNAWEVLKAQWLYAVPPVVVLCMMLAGYSLSYSAVIGIAACIAVSHKTRDTKIGFIRFVAATSKGVENSLKIGATVGFIGIVISVLTYTGLIFNFTDIVIILSDGSLVLTILLIALASLVLGMVIPIVATYFVIAVIAVPALTSLGINEVAAHMIVYWLALGSNIASPVCAPVFSGATIAGANRRRTAFVLFKFAQFLYIGPFLFGYVPGFSLDGSPGDIVVAFALILAGTFVHACILSLRRLDFFTGSPNRRK